MKLFDSELRVMEILWRNGDTTAKQLAEILNEQVGWGKTTTYTVIKKCLDKGAAARSEPGFVCSALVSKEQAQEAETAELIDKMYGGAADELVASILGRKTLSAAAIAKLKQLVADLE
jgi:predicted transcriptional regulator